MMNSIKNQNLTKFIKICCKFTTHFKLIKKSSILLFICSFLLLVSACASKDKDKEEAPLIKKSKVWEPNAEKRARKAADENPLFNKNKNSNTNFQFSTSNVLWRASLDSLSSIPLATVDYAGGIIITDWYSLNNDNSGQQIKLMVRFLSSELSVSSIVVSGHIKKCKTNLECNTSITASSLNDSIKSKIITNARKISIEDKNKKK